jgi:hypothetical protein
VILEGPSAPTWPCVSPRFSRSHEGIADIARDDIDAGDLLVLDYAARIVPVF